MFQYLQVPAGVQVVPMLLLHGWPGSVREFYESIPLLTAVSKDRDFALEVIVPSLPGYGFSDVSTYYYHNLFSYLGEFKFGSDRKI